MTTALTRYGHPVVPWECGPHVPYEDLQMHMRMPRPSYPEAVSGRAFSAAFARGDAKVWYDCSKCGVAFYFGNNGIGACCILPGGTL